MLDRDARLTSTLGRRTRRATVPDLGLIEPAWGLARPNLGRPDSTMVRSPFAVTSREWAVGRRWVLEPCSGAGLGGSWGNPFRWSISWGNEPLLPACQTFRGSRSLRHSGQRTRAVRPSWRALRVASAVRELALTRPHAFAPTLRLRATLNTSYALKTEPASQQPSRTKAPSDPSRDAPDEGSETRPAGCGATVVGVASTQAEPAGSWSLALNASR